MSVAGDIIEDLRFDSADKRRALTGLFSVVAVSIFLGIGFLSGAAPSDPLQTQASDVSPQKSASLYSGGRQ